MLSIDSRSVTSTCSYTRDLLGESHANSAPEKPCASIARQNMTAETIFVEWSPDQKKRKVKKSTRLAKSDQIQRVITESIGSQFGLTVGNYVCEIATRTSFINLRSDSARNGICMVIPSMPMVRRRLAERNPPLAGNRCGQSESLNNGIFVAYATKIHGGPSRRSYAAEAAIGASHCQEHCCSERPSGSD